MERFFLKYRMALESRDRKTWPQLLGQNFSEASRIINSNCFRVYDIQYIKTTTPNKIFFTMAFNPRRVRVVYDETTNKIIVVPWVG